MLALAEKAAGRPDARVQWLVRWIKANLLSGTTWNNRRLIIFTEWEDTRRWLEKRLREALHDTDRLTALHIRACSAHGARAAAEACLQPRPDKPVHRAVAS